MSRPLRILIVEDDADDAALIAMRFRAERDHVSIARVETADGLTQAVRSASWDVVISDHKMPGLTSLEALGLVRRWQPDMPFVIVSGQIGEELAVEALKAGADDYVLKDRLARLIPAVERAIAEAGLRRAERASAAALRVAQEHLQWLISSSRVVVYEADEGPSHALRFISDNVGLLTGDDTSSLACRAGCQWRRVHPDDAPLLAEALSRLTTTGEPQRYQYRWRRSDGTCRWVQEDARRAVGLHGSGLAIVGTLVDITDQRAFEEQLHRTQQMEAVGRLAGGVAHDFNNLLSVILGCSYEVQAQMHGNEPYVAAVHGIRRAAERGAALSSRLLALSRRHVLRPRVHDLNDIVRDIEPLVRSLFRKGVTVSVQTSGRAQLALVDAAQVEQIVLNLAINARDATPAGGAVTVIVGDGDGAWVTLTVLDTGTGIAPDVLPRIFEPFFTTKAPGLGTGLGLSMVRDVVMQNGGELVVDTKPGRGTAMTVRLPRAAAMSPPASSPAAAEVLLVDDDDLVREFMCRTLLASGHVVHVAESGVDALRLHESGRRIDVLVADLTMPGLGGVELARQLVARQPDLKVLLVSGSDGGEPGPGASDVLRKPFDAHDLLASINRLLMPSPPRSETGSWPGSPQA